MKSTEQLKQRCIEAYSRHKHLKKVGEEVGLPWQTVYVHLKNAGVAVTGDKARYGSDTDRLATKAETDFQRLVPFAESENGKQFQAKVDFIVRGYSVDVKASTERRSNKNAKTKRYAFCLKKQENLADFFVCLGYREFGALAICMLIPGEIARRYTTISYSGSAGKWANYLVSPDDLSSFFRSLNVKVA